MTDIINQHVHRSEESVMKSTCRRPFFVSLFSVQLLNVYLWVKFSPAQYFGEIKCSFCIFFSDFQFSYSNTAQCPRVIKITKNNKITANQHFFIVSYHFRVISLYSFIIFILCLKVMESILLHLMPG